MYIVYTNMLVYILEYYSRIEIHFRDICYAAKKFDLYLLNNTQQIRIYKPKQ